MPSIKNKPAPESPSLWDEVAEGVWSPGQKQRAQKSLEPGIYSVELTTKGPMFRPQEIQHDHLLPIPEPHSDLVLAGVNRFMDPLARERYRKHGVIYKRGILLYGPPGSGKTAVIQKVCLSIAGQGHLVLLARDLYQMFNGVKSLREIEGPDRFILCVVEDLDSLIEDSSDTRLLTNFLDGNYQVDNILFLATTNHPDKLPKVIISRPSRMDEVIEIGMPSVLARHFYLKHFASKHGLPMDQLEQWANDSEGLSIAHLKELCLAVFCLGQDYATVMARLRKVKFESTEEEE